MPRKWFQLVGEDGNAVTSSFAVSVDIEDVVALLDAVKEKYKDSHLAGIAASDLTVFANGVKLGPRDSLAHIDETVTLIVQLPQRAVAQSRFGVAASLWLVNGSVENALVTKGVRSRVYRLADSNLGFYVRKQDAAMNENAIWYEGKTLRIHVGFEAKEHALYFRSQIQSEPLTVGSPLRGAVVTTSVAQTTGVATQLRQILFSDYKPTDSESSQDTNSSIAPSVSTCGPTDDLFKYQRIEDASLFGSVGRAENAHLMSHAHCERYSTSYGKYDKDENNRLALSPDVHTFYDASVPAINIKAISSAPFEQGAENRYKVEIEVSVLDHSYKHLLNRLKEGSTLTEDPLVMRTFVEVKNPITFCKCLEWKFKQNQAAWQEYFTMDSAVE